MTSESWPPKGLPGAVRRAASGSGWQAWSGTLSRVEGGVAFHIYEFAGKAWFLAKPVIWDQTLWRVAGWGNPAERSASFHFKGLSVRVPALASETLHGADVDDLARQIVAFGARAFDGFDPAFEFSVPELVKRYAADARADDFVIAEVIWHLVEGRQAEARAISEAVIAGHRRSSFNMSTVNGSVFELVQRAVVNGEV